MTESIHWSKLANQVPLPAPAFARLICASFGAAGLQLAARVVATLAEHGY